LIQTIESPLKFDFFNTPKLKKELENQLQIIENNKPSPFAAADYVLRLKV